MTGVKGDMVLGCLLLFYVIQSYKRIDVTMILSMLSHVITQKR